MVVFETEGVGSNPTPESKKCRLCDNPRRKGGNTCKSCHNEYMKSYYKKNKLHSTPAFLKRRQERRDYILTRKDVPCADCGIKYPYPVMEFDHLRDKKFNISSAVNKAASMQALIDEISKCEVVCANCHRIRTFERM